MHDPATKGIMDDEGGGVLQKGALSMTYQGQGWGGVCVLDVNMVCLGSHVWKSLKNVSSKLHRAHKGTY